MLLLISLLSSPVDDAYTLPYERPALPAGASWGHAPAHHAGEYVYPGRAVLRIPGHQWLEVPERCSNTDPCANDWYGQDAAGWPTVLVCRLCGLDVT